MNIVRKTRWFLLNLILSIALTIYKNKVLTEVSDNIYVILFHDSMVGGWISVYEWIQISGKPF
jgi:hypothetical protein